jgi:lipopolysaccharide export LptBFGC system permease protein LptF
MTDNQDQKYAYYKKVAWAIYALLALILAVVLVLFVAQDNEERFFYGFMTVAGAYVFRPTDRFFSKLIFKYTGVSQATEKE